MNALLWLGLFAFMGTLGAAERSDQRKFSWEVSSTAAVQMQHAGDDTTAPVLLQYDDGAALVGLDAALVIGEHIFVKQDIQFRVREDRYFERRPVTNIIRDLNDFNAHIFRESYVAVTQGSAEFTLGRRGYAFGPGHTGSTILSNNVPFYDVLALQYNFKKATFNFLTSRINITRTPLVYSYHRISFLLPAGLQLGFSEANLVFAEAYDFLNINPVMFFHNIDRKNTNYIGGADLAWVHPQWRMYTDIGIDNILWRAIEENSSSPTGIGFLVGTEYGKSAGGVQVYAEYARIERYMYARDPLGLRGDSLHFMVDRDYPQVTSCINAPHVMGYWSGPNSETVQLGATWHQHKDVFAVDLDYIRLRRGNLDATKTLVGIIEQRHILKLGCTWKPLQQFTLNLRYSLSDIDNYMHVAGNHYLLNEFGVTASVQLFMSKGAL